MSISGEPDKPQFFKPQVYLKIYVMIVYVCVKVTQLCLFVTP